MDGKPNIIIPIYLRLIYGVHSIWPNDPKIHMEELKARIVKTIPKKNKMGGWGKLHNSSMGQNKKLRPMCYGNLIRKSLPNRSLAEG